MSYAAASSRRLLLRSTLQQRQHAAAAPLAARPCATRRSGSSSSMTRAMHYNASMRAAANAAPRFDSAPPSSSLPPPPRPSGGSSFSLKRLALLLALGWGAVEFMLVYPPTRDYLNKNHPALVKQLKASGWFFESNKPSMGQWGKEAKERVAQEKSITALLKPTTATAAPATTPAAPVVAPAVVIAPVVVAPSVVAAPAPAQNLSLDPQVQARMDEALRPKAATAAPTPVAAAPSIVRPLPPTPLRTAATPVSSPSSPSSPTPSTPAERAQFEELLAALQDAQSSLSSFMATQDATLWDGVRDWEAELKAREERRLQSLEVEQRHTLASLTKRQDHALFRAQEQHAGPELQQFKEDLELEEENKYRARLYAAMEEQNDRVSEVADEWLDKQEVDVRAYYAMHELRLKNAVEALENGILKDLKAQLALARHRELRSKQAHKLSAALLQLQSSIGGASHVGFGAAWKVVTDIAKQDDTLAKAIAPIAADTVAQGIYSVGDLRRAFTLMAAELKRTTFLPDRTSLWSVPREAVARVFAALTLDESGSVVLAAPQGKSEFDHQRSDYAHLVNAGTYLASDALTMALVELEQIHPTRRAPCERLIEELKRTVQVQEAIKVIHMRVMALNLANAQKR